MTGVFQVEGEGLAGEAGRRVEGAARGGEERFRRLGQGVDAGPRGRMVQSRKGMVESRKQFVVP